MDDGLATGSTARAACLVAPAQGAVRIVLAVSVAPKSAVAGSAMCATTCLRGAARSFLRGGEWYADFSPTSDDEVVELLRRGAQSSLNVNGLDGPLEVVVTTCAEGAVEDGAVTVHVFWAGPLVGAVSPLKVATIRPPLLKKLAPAAMTI